ncbi:YuzL family protein [Anoxybacillus suryakundensis]|uniref:YuzL-like protein n=1 Tax=Anoxybacillus suryakundensis TaxID=1325335 RepID=A0A0K6GPE3_9BACL|nr:YuzL family protein [Anoxybacillus suryakundensis]CUA80610.1 YuzL-like protein [Anoxybacillus suryakundensis]
MGKRKKDASKTGLSSPEIKGQGTMEKEPSGIEVDSSRKKTKRM